MENHLESIASTKRSYRNWALLVSSLLILSSILYLVIQFLQERKISDGLFISLTLFESFFVLYSGSIMIGYFERKGLSFYTSLNYFTDPEKPKGEMIKLICIFNQFKKTWFWVIMLVWAVGQALLPYIQGYWKDNLQLNIFFGIFTFFSTIIGAYFAILLFGFLKQVRKLWSIIKVELWNRENPAAKFIFSASKWAAILSAVYLTSALTAWNTSPKVTLFHKAIIVYFIVAISLLTLCIIVPLLPFVRKIKELKTNALSEIDSNIQTEYSILITEFKKDKNTTQFDKINKLIDMRNKIESIHTFPFHLKTISAGLSITIISLLPKIIELILKYLF